MGVLGWVSAIAWLVGIPSGIGALVSLATVVWDSMPEWGRVLFALSLAGLLLAAVLAAVAATQRASRRRREHLASRWQETTDVLTGLLRSRGCPRRAERAGRDVPEEAADEVMRRYVDDGIRGDYLRLVRETATVEPYVREIAMDRRVVEARTPDDLWERVVAPMTGITRRLRGVDPAVRRRPPDVPAD